MAVGAPGPYEGVVRGDLTRSADLLREGRGLVDRAEARDAAAAWTGRVNTVTARTDRVDVDALLIRPDGCVAWALPAGTSPPPRWCVRWAHGSANRPEHRINSRLRFAPYEVGVQVSDATRM
ncbi:aromatic-ring hydroxylase C-terminal domain-containing protein [Streptomyces sp. NPDC054837]